MKVSKIYHKFKAPVSIALALYISTISLLPSVINANPPVDEFGNTAPTQNQNAGLSNEQVNSIKSNLDSYTSKTRDLITIIRTEQTANRVPNENQFLQLELFSLQIKYNYSLIEANLDENQREIYKTILTQINEFNDDYDNALRAYGAHIMSGSGTTFNKSVADNLRDPLERSLDLTPITGGGIPLDDNGNPIEGFPEIPALSTEETERWLRDNKENYKQKLAIHQSLISLYESLGEDSIVTNMREVNRSWMEKFEALLNAAGLGSNFDNIADIAVNVDTNSDTAIIDIWDAAKNDFTDEYLELLAWTANFTPFETNIYDNNIKRSLTQNSMNLYHRYGSKRSPIYSTTADRGVVAGLKSGARYSMTTITLQEFIDDFQRKQMAFFIQNSSEAEIEQRRTEQVESSNANENEDAQRAATVTSTITSEFIGPVYVQSGASTLGLKNVDQLAEEAIRQAGNPRDPNYNLLGHVNAMLREGIRHIDMISSNHMNMNYILMSNSIDSGAFTQGSIRADLSRPLYLDFLGNIVTESGFIVVPAAANYTYYLDARNLPISNAMFLNGYPETGVDGEGKIQLSKAERNKYVFLRDQSNDIAKFARINRLGNKSSKEISVLTPKTKVEYSNGFSTTEIDFMDPIQAFIDAKRSYRGLVAQNEREGEALFVNPGVTLSKRFGAQDRVANLQKISADGRGVDWVILTEINKNNIKDTTTISRQIMVDIATTLKDSSDTPNSMILSNEISVGSRELQNPTMTNIFGQIFEGIHNRLFASAQTNYLLFTPKLSELPILRDYGLIAAPITIVAILLTFIALVILFGFSVFNKTDITIAEVILSIVALSTVGVIVLYASGPAIDFLYNKPAQALLRDEIFMYVLEDIEGRYKDVNPTYFDEIKDADFSGNAEIVIEKLNRDEVLEVRRKVTNTPEVFNMFYMPEFDQNPTNVLGDKVYLKGNTLMMNVSDLLSINSLDDKLDDFGNIALEHNYGGYGELAFYMPYFNINESLTHTINSFTEGSRTAYRTIGYQRGFSMSTGRSSSYFRSILFIAPELTEQYMRDAESQYARNFYRDAGLSMPIATDEDGGNPRITLDEVDLEYTQAMKSAVLFLTENMGGDLNDWLGLRRMLFLTEDLGPFSPESEPIIRSTKWYPREHHFTREQVDNKIYKINDRTKRFVLNNILPIANNISDDTIIKLVSLYATMEYNREFSVPGHRLYPTAINTKGLSNDYMAKTTLIPQQELYRMNTNQLGRYLAEEASWPGLLVATLLRLTSLTRMMIRLITVITLMISLPFVVYYLYVMRKNVYSKYLWGALTTGFAITMIYILDILWYKASFSIVNNLGTVSYLGIAVIPEIVLTSVAIMAAMAILSDVGNFGYKGYKDLSNKVWRGMSDNNLETDEELRERLEEEGFNYEPVVDSAMYPTAESREKLMMTSDIEVESSLSFSTLSEDVEEEAESLGVRGKQYSNSYSNLNQNSNTTSSKQDESEEDDGESLALKELQARLAGLSNNQTKEEVKSSIITNLEDDGPETKKIEVKPEDKQQRSNPRLENIKETLNGAMPPHTQSNLTHQAIEEL